MLMMHPDTELKLSWGGIYAELINLSPGLNAEIRPGNHTTDVREHERAQSTCPSGS